ncbi:MAG: SPFH domain-containing protein [Clostridia bacterium]|nr:SPFH domain-containing protein [Clostridia bacterium]
MGILSRLAGQFIDVIEWTDSSSNTMVYRFNKEGNAIMMGAQLIVRESQVAVMVNEGRIADVFGPGRYELSTQNMPIMTALQSWRYGFNSPFKAEVYFVNTRQFLNMKWGTSNPVMMRDAEFGMVRLRAFGVYSFSVADPKVFLQQVFGTSQLFTTEGVSEYLKRVIVSSLSDILAESKIPALDLAANYGELGGFAISVLSPKFAELGLRLNSFSIENISLPQEVEQAIDRRSSMGVVGDLNRYTQFQTAEAIREAANNPNGAAGMSTGLGLGAAISQMMQQQSQPKSSQPAYNAQTDLSALQSTPSSDTKFCPECGQKIPRTAKFCPECGTKQS